MKVERQAAVVRLFSDLLFMNALPYITFFLLHGGKTRNIV